MGLSAEQKATAISLAASGKPLAAIREAVGLSSLDFHHARVLDQTFDREFMRARLDGMEEIADQLLTAHEDIADAQRAKIFSDNARWILSKRKADVYGDRLDLTVNQTIDIGQALEAAHRRALPQRDQRHALDSEPIDVEHETVSSPTDNVSVDGAAGQDADEEGPVDPLG